MIKKKIISNSNGHGNDEGYPQGVNVVVTNPILNSNNDMD
jgi:hypothetical protein